MRVLVVFAILAVLLAMPLAAQWGAPCKDCAEAAGGVMICVGVWEIATGLFSDCQVFQYLGEDICMLSGICYWV